MEKILNVDYYDLVLTYSNLYDEEKIEQLMEKAAASGFTTVLWRLSICGVTAYHSTHRTMFQGHHIDSPNAYNMVRILKRFDPLRVAIKYAHKYSLQLFSWITLMDEDFNQGLISDFVQRHPQFTLESKDGSRHLTGALCYWYDEVVDYQMRQIDEVLNDYDIDGMYLCTRSHAKFANTSRALDDFGFNEPVVQEYKVRYGIDIRTQPFNKSRWYEIQGEGLTRFIEQASSHIHNQGLPLWIGIHSDGLSMMNISPMAHMKLDWDKWMSSGCADGLIVAAGEPVLDRHDHWFNEISQKFASVRESGKGLYVWFRLWDWRNEYPYYPKPVETKDPDLIREVVQQYSDLFDGYAYHEALNIEHYDLWEQFKDF